MSYTISSRTSPQPFWTSGSMAMSWVTSAYMPPVMILMQGIPGSGKSHFANKIAEHEHGVIHSTDNYWGEDYNFDPKLLSAAHEWNQFQTFRSMQAGIPVVIIDNCNIKQAHIEPYLALAKKFGYDVIAVRVNVNLHIALQRNSERQENRRVPDNTIKRMCADMEVLSIGDTT